MNAQFYGNQHSDPFHLGFMEWEPTDWHADSACKDMDTSIFFPLEMPTGVPLPIRMICDGCIVKTECLDFAVRNNERGIWAATTEKDRHRIRLEIERSLPSDQE